VTVVGFVTPVFLFEGCGVSIIPLALLWCRGFAGSYVVVHPSFSLSSFSSKSSVLGVVVHASRRTLVSFSAIMRVFVGTTEMDWTMGVSRDDDDFFTHASASALDEKLCRHIKVEKKKRRRSVFWGGLVSIIAGTSNRLR